MVRRDECEQRQLTSVSFWLGGWAKYLNGKLHAKKVGFEKRFAGCQAHAVFASSASVSVP